MSDMLSNQEFRTAKMFGFITASLSSLFYIMFDVAAVLGLTGIVKSKFWISLSWYGPSLLLAYSFLGMSLSIYRDGAWGDGAIKLLFFNHSSRSQTAVR